MKRKHRFASHSTHNSASFGGWAFHRRDFFRWSWLSLAGLALSRLCGAQRQPPPPRFLTQSTTDD